MKEGIDWCTVVWQVTGANGSSGANEYMPLIVAVLAGCFTVATVILGRIFQDFLERRSVRASLLAEVAALRDVVEMRGYLGDLRETAEELRGEIGERMRDAGKAWKFVIPIQSDYNQIYKANLGRLGVLSEHEAVSIVRFHLLAESVRTDVSEGGILYEGSDEAEDFDDAADLLEQAMVLASELVMKRLSWWRRLTARLWALCGR
ncbi:hypothetical protein RTH46_02890 [Pseudomonas sp. zfem004]|uniref:hypothetical protein n=1 Tax=Pseudomonas sp. zfem004 TaxID=3078199 RepID=UPI002928428D|nr:hypothetical protein [Pseudomonas sp. zfem004]MDU9401442.1 hypothetical protein [Pseudomonas sp. zfem004]